MKPLGCKRKAEELQAKAGAEQELLCSPLTLETGRLWVGLPLSQ